MDLKEKARKLLADARAILDAADREKRAATGDELERYERIMADFDAAQATIRATDRVTELEARSGLSAARTDGGGGRETAAAEIDEFRAEFMTPEQRAVEERLGSREYRSRYGAFLRRGEARDLVAGLDSAGGYTVPTGFYRGFVQKLEDENLIRQYATVIRTSTGENLPIPGVASHGSASYGTETSDVSFSDETFDGRALRAHRASTGVKLSKILIADSAFDLEGYLQAEIARRFGALEEAKFTTGSGANEPTGIVTRGELGETTASASAITGDEIMNLYYALKRPYRRRAVFGFLDSTIKALRKLKTGVAGDNTFLWEPSLKADEPDTLLGRPVLPLSSLAAIGASATVGFFGDLSYYWIRDAGRMSMQRLVELYAVSGKVGLIGEIRNDADLVIPEAVKTLVMHS